MELQEALKERRSIRKYKVADVLKEDVMKIIEAAILAPSWKNSLVTRYHVVTSKETVQNIKENALPEFNMNNSKNAPVLIVMSFVRSLSGFDKDQDPANEIGEGWGFYDCGLASENLLLKAHELGYGTLIMGIRDQAKIREILDIPKEEIIVSVVALGVKDIDPVMPKRKTISEVSKWY